MVARDATISHVRFVFTGDSQIIGWKHTPKIYSNYVAADIEPRWKRGAYWSE